MRFPHCIYAVLATVLLIGSPAATPDHHLILAAAAGRFPSQAQSTETHGFIVFQRGAAVGREDVTTQRSTDGFVISGRARVAPPLDIVVQQVEMRYRADWTPVSLSIDGQVRGHTVAIRTSFKDTEAVSETTEDGRALTRTHKVSPKTIVIPNLFFGTYHALAARLVDAQPGTELPAYVAPESEIPVHVRAIYNESVQTTVKAFSVKRYALTAASPGGELVMQVTADEAGNLIRLSVPAQSLDVVREDVASANARTATYSNRGDQSVTIPAEGFNIAATVTTPPGAGRFPAVVLLSGAGADDRDSVVANVPIMAQIAGALADAGFLSIRFDKRGFGQSGGRAEGAALADFAEDARTVVKYLSGRKEVDSKRIAILGHSEGAWVAMLAAAHDKKVAAVAFLAAAASSGADLVLEQQRHVLDLMNASDSERQQKIALQHQIDSAVLTGQGWDGVPRAARTQADTPWFQSFLRFDPARALKNVHQPVLIIQGELDQQVSVGHAGRLADLARKVSASQSVEVVTVPGINHLLVPASTGEVAEYGSLRDLHVSKDVTAPITGWLSKVLAVR
jgi:pimeloyl-ACP methyl ester carboxylesterase